MQSLREAVGLIISSDNFWKDLSKQTIKLTPREKLYLLAEVVGSDLNMDQLTKLPSMVNEVLDKLQRKYQVSSIVANSYMNTHVLSSC